MFAPRQSAGHPELLFFAENPVFDFTAGGEAFPFGRNGAPHEHRFLLIFASTLASIVSTFS